MPKTIIDIYDEDTKNKQIELAIANGGKYLIEKKKDKTEDKYIHIYLYRLANGKLKRLTQYNKRKKREEVIKYEEAILNKIKNLDKNKLINLNNYIDSLDTDSLE